MLLAVCVPIRFLSVAMGSVLLTEDHMRYRVYAMGLAAAGGRSVCNLLLIPRFQRPGRGGGDGHWRVRAVAGHLLLRAALRQAEAGLKSIAAGPSASVALTPLEHPAVGTFSRSLNELRQR